MHSCSRSTCRSPHDCILTSPSFGSHAAPPDPAHRPRGRVRTSAPFSTSSGTGSSNKASHTPLWSLLPGTRSGNARPPLPAPDRRRDRRSPLHQPQDRNKAVTSPVFEGAVITGDLSILQNLYADDFVDRSASIGRSSGVDGMALRTTSLREQVPGIHSVIEALVAEGDLVTSRVSWHGTHPPSRTHLVGRTLHLFRLSDDRIVEE